LSGRAHHTDYDDEATARCERVLLTLIGDLGPWGDRVYLVGGLAPRYLVNELPDGVEPHVGTTDVDLVIGLALADESPETYNTLQKNLTRVGFEQGDSSFQWVRRIDGAKVTVEFLCETDQVDPGRIFRPTGEHTGPGLGAFNVRGAQLVRDDYVECVIEGERLDGGGHSRVTARVANVLAYTVLKIFAFQDRHENKDAYDLVFTLFHHEDGPRAAGQTARSSAIAGHAQVEEAVALLRERFRDVGQDGPSAYALFLADPDDDDGRARLRQEAVATIREFLEGFAEAPARSTVDER
jgi:hypothetical protein